jgi:predicted nucleic acid-binding protein
MIVLDTNVVSALMRRQREETVVSWLDTCAPENIWTTAVTVYEVRVGLEQLEIGQRRTALEESFQLLLSDRIESRVLPFDLDAANAAAVLSMRRRRSGRPVEIRDIQIGGIVISRQAVLATRNSRDFEDAEIRVLNPWAEPS